MAESIEREQPGDSRRRNGEHRSSEDSIGDAESDRGRRPSRHGDPQRDDAMEGESGNEAEHDEGVHHVTPNPPRTTKNGITSPKFGSAGSGGAEIEPGTERP